MSVGPLSVFGSVAASPLAQRASDSDRVHQDTAREQAETSNDLQAEKAAGIDETDGQEHSPNERDADGRRPWEIAAREKKLAVADDATPHPIRQSRDITGTTGTQLDLTG
jgi:hypothetical protein